MSSFDPASLHIIRRLDELESSLHSAIRDSSTGSFNPGVQTSEGSRPQSHHTLDRSLLLPTEPEQLYDFANLQQSHTPLASVYKSSTSLGASPFVTSHNSSIDADLDGPTCKRLLDNFFRWVHVKNREFPSNFSWSKDCSVSGSPSMATVASENYLHISLVHVR